MSTVDDLLSQRRRGTLSEADERRLKIAVQTSPEHELTLLAGAVFDRDGAAQPGDATLVREIVRQVEGEWSGTFQRVVARRRLSRWVSLPVLVAGVAAASFGGYRAFEVLRGPAELAAAPAALPEPPQIIAAAPAELAVEPAPSRVTAAPLAVSPELSSPELSPPERGAAPAASAAAPAVMTRGRHAGVARRGLPAAPAAAVASTAVAAPEVSGSAPLPETDETARELFRRANRLRQQDWSAAAALYERLTQRFADTHEAGVSEMALAKHALAEGRSNEAVHWFRAYQRRAGGELAAEALWGEAQALDNLGERPRAHALWRVLVEQYPASAYAAAAREQLGPLTGAQP